MKACHSPATEMATRPGKVPGPGRQAPPLLCKYPAGSRLLQRALSTIGKRVPNTTRIVVSSPYGVLDGPAPAPPATRDCCNPASPGLMKTIRLGSNRSAESNLPTNAHLVCISPKDSTEISPLSPRREEKRGGPGNRDGATRSADEKLGGMSLVKHPGGNANLSPANPGIECI